MTLTDIDDAVKRGVKAKDLRSDESIYVILEELSEDLAENSEIFRLLGDLVSIRVETKMEHVLFVLQNFKPSLLNTKLLRNLFEKAEIDISVEVFSTLMLLVVALHDVGAVLLAQPNEATPLNNKVSFYDHVKKFGIFSALTDERGQKSIQIINDVHQDHALLSAVLIKKSIGELLSFQTKNMKSKRALSEDIFQAVRLHHLVEQVDKKILTLQEAASLLGGSDVRFVAWFSLFIADTTAALNRFTAGNIAHARAITNLLYKPNDPIFEVVKSLLLEVSVNMSTRGVPLVQKGGDLFDYAWESKKAAESWIAQIDANLGIDEQAQSGI